MTNTKENGWGVQKLAKLRKYEELEVTQMRPRKIRRLLAAPGAKTGSIPENEALEDGLGNCCGTQEH